MEKKHQIRFISGAVLLIAVFALAVYLAMNAPASGMPETIGYSFESAFPSREESRLLLPQLLPPLAVFFAVCISFMAVKRRKEKKYARLDEPLDVKVFRVGDTDLRTPRNPGT